jgi:competence protein ComGC
MRNLFEKRPSAIETLISIIIITILITIIRSSYNKLEFSAHKNMVKYDLNNLNLITKLFKIKKGRYPVNLKELYKSGYFKFDKKGYIENTKSKFINNDLIDVFGNKYIYDNKTGKVQLNTKTIELINNE